MDPLIKQADWHNVEASDALLEPRQAVLHDWRRYAETGAFGDCNVERYFLSDASKVEINTMLMEEDLCQQLLQSW
jgi:hypothetical protein